MTRCRFVVTFFGVSPPVALARTEDRSRAPRVSELVTFSPDDEALSPWKVYHAFFTSHASHDEADIWLFDPATFLGDGDRLDVEAAIKRLTRHSWERLPKPPGLDRW